MGDLSQLCALGWLYLPKHGGFSSVVGCPKSSSSHPNSSALSTAAEAARYVTRTSMCVYTAGRKHTP